jgi:Secretion system C-terminal sorting domain
MRIFYILASSILLLTAQAKAQTHLGPLPDPEDKVIKYYPNPAVSLINFEFQKSYDKSFSLQIFNFLGKKVMEFQTLEPKTQVNLSDFFRGIYIFQLRDPTGKIIESGKFQVIK